MSQGDLRVQVGLGTHAAPVDVEVRMPGGARWRWRGLAIDRLHALALTPETRIGAQAGASRAMHGFAKRWIGSHVRRPTPCRPQYREGRPRTLVAAATPWAPKRDAQWRPAR